MRLKTVGALVGSLLLLAVLSLACGPAQRLGPATMTSQASQTATTPQPTDTAPPTVPPTSTLQPGTVVPSATPPATTTEEPTEASQPTLARVTQLTDNGGRVSWSASRNLLVFDSRGEDGYFDIYTMNPDGSDWVCLTCENPALPGRNMGNPEWHPSGEYIVFQAEKRDHRRNSIAAEPGRGINNDLWVMTSDGRQATLLMSIEEGWGLLHPHFSHDGAKVLWAENSAGGFVAGDTNGELKLADFVVDGSGPHLEQITSIRPREGAFYESHGFSLDGTKILFSGNLEPGQRTIALDIYTLDLETNELVNLTSTLDQWDEHAHYLPDGSRIIWMSSMGCNWDRRVVHLCAEYWVMDADGSNKAQLSFFNTPGHLGFTGKRIVAGDHSPSPDGSAIAARLDSWSGDVGALELGEQDLTIAVLEIDW